MKKFYKLTKKYPYVEAVKPSRLRRESQGHLVNISTEVCNELARMGYNKEASTILVFFQRLKDDIRLATTSDFNRTLTLDIGSLKATFEIVIKFDSVRLVRIYEVSLGY